MCLFRVFVSGRHIVTFTAFVYNDSQGFDGYLKVPCMEKPGNSIWRYG